MRTPDGNVKVLLDETHRGGSDLPLAGNPKHLGIDAQDNVLICDELHHLLRKYLPAEGKLVTIMGDGKPGTGGLAARPSRRSSRIRMASCFIRGRSMSPTA